MAGFPGACSRLFPVEFSRINADVIGHEAQRDFPQRSEILFAKKTLCRSGGAVRQIDLALFQSLDEFGRRKVHQFEHRVIQHTVGNRFP